MPSTNDFDPVAVFPARVRNRVIKATAAEKGKAARGYCDTDKGAVAVPIQNTAYDRTVRLHESLHALYTKKKPDGTNLCQGLEDARLHLNYAKTEGGVRRDELATALKDLRRIPADKDLAAILALRSAAIFDRGFPEKSRAKISRALDKLRAMAESVHPDFPPAIGYALEKLRTNDYDGAASILKPYFTEAHSVTKKSFPSSGMGGDGTKDSTKQFADVSFEKLEGKMTEEATALIGGKAQEMLDACKFVPKLHIRQLWANYSIPTFYGETEKHKLTGCKIDPKKLALVIGPVMPKIFRSTIHRNGGTVVIDSSGSMSIGTEQLLKLVTAAPLATVGFYNAPNDLSSFGNLWIFAHKGKRAIDLRDVKMRAVWDSTKSMYEKGSYGTYSKEYLDYAKQYHELSSGKIEDGFGGGNVVDFQVLQWLLAQPGPRYILTDGGFTGPTADLGKALLDGAMSRKLITQITSVAEMEKVLAAGVERKTI